MRTILLALAFVAVLAPDLLAADPDFDAVVRGIEKNFGVRRTHIPMLGLGTFFVKTTRPNGVKQLDLAIFEDLRTSPADQERFERIVHSAVGDRWSPMIRVRSRRDGESTSIYVKPSGDAWNMIVATCESDEVVVVRLKMKPEMLLESLNDPSHAGKRLGSGDE